MAGEHESFHFTHHVVVHVCTVSLSLDTVTLDPVTICSNRSQAQIVARARIEAGCQLSVSLIEAGAPIECQLSVSVIEAGARIEAGFECTPGTPPI